MMEFIEDNDALFLSFLRKNIQGCEQFLENRFGFFFVAAQGDLFQEAPCLREAFLGHFEQKLKFFARRDELLVFEEVIQEAVDEAFPRFWLIVIQWRHEIFETRTYSILHKISYSDLYKISEKDIEMGFGGVCQEMRIRSDEKISGDHY